jgi:hypothetical protein
MSDDGGVYADFIEKELEDQRASKTSMEQRSVAVVTTVGVLVTVLFGFVTLKRNSKAPFHIPHSARLWFYGALVAFVAAVISSLAVTMPRRRAYRSPTPDALDEIVKTRWQDSASLASQRVAATRVVVLRSYLYGNRKKGIALGAAVFFEVAGVLLLAIAIGLVIHAA